MPADEKLAADFYRRGVSLETVRRAIWLDCCRKYAALSNGQPAAPIVSLGYFAALLDEVTRAPVSDSYSEHVRQKLQTLERRWQPSLVPSAPPEG